MLFSSAHSRLTLRISPWCATLVWSTHGLISAFTHVGRQFGTSRPNTLTCGLRKRPWSFLMGVTIVTPNIYTCMHTQQQNYHYVITCVHTYTYACIHTSMHTLTHTHIGAHTPSPTHKSSHTSFPALHSLATLSRRLHAGRRE